MLEGGVCGTEPRGDHARALLQDVGGFVGDGGEARCLGKDDVLRAIGRGGGVGAGVDRARRARIEMRMHRRQIHAAERGLDFDACGSSF